MSSGTDVGHRSPARGPDRHVDPAHRRAGGRYHWRLMGRRVLVALDETDASQRAAAFVNEFFRGLDVEVLALNVAHSPVVAPAVPYGVVSAYAWADPYASAPIASAEAQLQEAAVRGREVIAHEGVHADETLVEVGDPATVILDAARNHECDLIVVGTSHKGWWSRLFEGSVSDAVVHHARCPVLVVR